MSSKKDKLKGAIQSELKGDTIMHEFIKNVNEDKQGEPDTKSKSSQTSSSQKQKKEDKKEEKKATRQKPRRAQGSSGLPAPRNNTPKEWWLSFLAFLFITGLIFGAYFISTYESLPGSYIRLSGEPWSEHKIYPHDSAPNFRIHTPIYINYISKEALNTDLVSIHVYTLQSEGTRNLLTSSQYKIDRRWRKLETHFQKEFFENPGKYEIIIQDENNTQLARQFFEVTR